MEWLAGSEMQNASTLSVARMFVLPGAESERHRHSNCEEAILVVAGSAEFELGADSSRHLPGECTVVPAGTAHRVRNVGDAELELLLMYGAGEREYEPC